MSKRKHVIDNPPVTENKVLDKPDSPVMGGSISYPPDSILTDPKCLFMCNYLYERAKKKNVQPDELKRWMGERYGASSMKQLTLSQYKELKQIIKALDANE